jgi:hypothetical protein
MWRRNITRTGSMWRRTLETGRGQGKVQQHCFLPWDSPRCAMCTVYCALCTVYCVNTVHYARCTVHYALCTMHCTVHCVLCTMHYALHCALSCPSLLTAARHPAVQQPWARWCAATRCLYSATHCREHSPVFCAAQSCVMCSVHCSAVQGSPASTRCCVLSTAGQYCPVLPCCVVEANF